MDEEVRLTKVEDNVCHLQLDVVELRTRAEERQLAWMTMVARLDSKIDNVKGSVLLGNIVVVAALASAILVHLFIKGA